MAVLSFRSLYLSLVIPLLAVAQSAPPLQNFQVQQPPPQPPSRACSHVLVTHSFANSYYQPAVLAYTPPTDCGPVGEWAAISMNFTATSQGIQYDRLIVISLNSTEIWRSSTAEPTPNGIVFTSLKDVTRYSNLFASTGGNLVVELDNILEPSANLTGVYNATVTATFYAPAYGWPKTQKADQIIALGNPGASSNPVFTVPPGGNTSVTFPRNTAQAFVEIYASGNSNEEFWYTNVADEYFYDLPTGATYPRGPFREVRLLIDGQLAGAAFPYPVVFTGGILPTLWRPISSYGSFDQPTYYVDVTPWLGTLTDGNPHVFTLDVAGPESNHTINANWYVSGNIQLKLASTSKPTTGKITSYNASPYAISTIDGVVAANGDVNVTVKSTRYVQVEAQITTDGWNTQTIVWTQSLEYSSFQAYLDNANIEIVNQASSGSSKSTHNGQQVLYDQFSFPFYIDFYSVTVGNATGYNAVVDHSYDRQFLPDPLIPESVISTHQISSGTFLEYPNGTETGNGTTTETFSYYSSTGDTYTRTVTATNSNVTSDQQGGSLAGEPLWAWGWGLSWIPRGVSGSGSKFVGRLCGPARKAGQGLKIW